VSKTSRNGRRLSENLGPSLAGGFWDLGPSGMQGESKKKARWELGGIKMLAEEDYHFGGYRLLVALLSNQKKGTGIGPGEQSAGKRAGVFNQGGPSRDEKRIGVSAIVGGPKKAQGGFTCQKLLTPASSGE